MYLSDAVCCDFLAFYRSNAFQRHNLLGFWVPRAVCKRNVTCFYAVLSTCLALSVILTHHPECSFTDAAEFLELRDRSTVLKLLKRKMV